MVHAIAVAGGLIGAGMALAGGAICAGVGDGLSGAATINGTARQPEAQGRLTTIMFLIIGLAEGMYFINFALAILFIFVIAAESNSRMVLLDAAPLGPLQINATLVVEFVAFLIMLGILARWVYPPVMAAAEERQNRIKQQLDQAEKARTDAEEARQQAEAEIVKAREQAGQIIERANRAGERVEQEAQQKAKDEARRIVEAASRDIDTERQKAIQAIRVQMADIVGAAVGKIVADGLDGERHRKLIDAAIAQVEKEPSATK